MDQLIPIPYSLFLIPLNYYDSDVIPFTFCVECGEIRSQSHSIEYGCLDPYIPRNTRGGLYPYIHGGFNYSDPVWYVTGPKIGITLSSFFVEVIIICMCPTVQFRCETVELAMGNHLPLDIPPLVCPLILVFTANYPEIHSFSMTFLLALRISVKSLVPLVYFIRWTNLS